MDDFLARCFRVLSRRASRSASSPAGRPRFGSFRPSLESLETRLVPAGLVLDNGDAGFATVGAWTRNINEGYQGDMHHISTPGGTGSRTATWTFSGLTPGQYRVSATWTAHTNRATNSPFTVLDGSAPLGSVRFNQQLAPNDFIDQGAAWEDLGQFSVVGSQLVVRLSDDANGYVIADAVRIERIGDLPATVATIKDNGDPGFSTVGSWVWNTSEGYLGDMHHISTPGGTGSRTATWTFSGLTPGQYRVSATWTAHTNRATNSPFTVLDGSAPLGSIRFNQQTAPNDFTDQGVAWEDLGTFSIATGAATVRLSDDANGYVIADAIRIERIGDLPTTVVTIQDNGDAGFSTVGAWTRNINEGYLGDMHHSSTPGGTGTRTASWSFSGLTPGQYRVSATWTAYTNRATNSPFTVLDGGTVLGMARVNQQAAPGDFTDQGAAWEDLGIFGIASGSATVQLSDEANGYVIADAVRLERLGNLPTGSFVEETVVSGLASPTAMVFAPDGRLFVAEQGGTLRVIKNGALLSTPFLSVPVNSSGERGLLGIAFDPNFATNGYVYVYYTATSPTVHNRVSRITASGDVAVAGSEVQILNLETLSATNHNGGAIHFGSDGMLYIAVGENAVPANAQTLSNRLGKMLRINVHADDFPGDATRNYSIPTDNPFYAQATGENRAIWALGLRNPYNFAVQPGTGQIFINDVGQSAWEEINLGVAGANYGWSNSEGFRKPGDAATSIGTYRDPLYAYGHGSGTTRGIAIVGAAFYNPPTVQFPADYVGDYFFADFGNNWIARRDSATGAVHVFDASTAGFPVDVAVGPDGALYYAARQGGVVARIRFVP